jgi:quercetin dioxygenase-like cupin family protein
MANSKVTVDGSVEIAKPGLVAIVPANVRHSVKALTDGKVIIVDYPARRGFVLDALHKDG